MTRAALAFGVGILAAAGIAAARHDEDAESVKPWRPTTSSRSWTARRRRRRRSR